MLYNIVLAMGTVVFLGVEGFIVYSVFRYRRSDDRLPPQTHGNNLVEIIWTAIPTVIVLILFMLSIVTLARVEAAGSPDAGVDIEVDGFQWQWQFRYLDDDPAEDYTVVGSPASSGGHGGAGGRAGAADAGVERRDPLVLRAAVPDQAGPDPVPGERDPEHAGVHGHRGGPTTANAPSSAATCTPR